MLLSMHGYPHGHGGDPTDVLHVAAPQCPGPARGRRSARIFVPLTSSLRSCPISSRPSNHDSP